MNDPLEEKPVIAGESTWARWEMPGLSSGGTAASAGDASGESDQQKAVVQDLEALREQARAEGFAQGHAEGLAAGHREAEAVAAQWQHILGALAEPLQAVDTEVETQLAQLAIAIARALLRREFAAEPENLMGVVRESLSALPVSARDIVVYLHPEDVRMVRELLGDNDTDRNWRMEESSSLERGDCEVVTAQSRIDGRLETRLNRVAIELLGGVLRRTHSDNPDE